MLNTNESTDEGMYESNESTDENISQILLRYYNSYNLSIMFNFMYGGWWRYGKCG